MGVDRDDLEMLCNKKGWMFVEEHLNGGWQFECFIGGAKTLLLIDDHLVLRDMMKEEKYDIGKARDVEMEIIYGGVRMYNTERKIEVGYDHEGWFIEQHGDVTKSLE